MNLFYLKRGKEELLTALELFKNLNNTTVPKIVEHLKKGMCFMIDFLNNKHIDLISELKSSKALADKVFGKDFLETYFYLDGLTNKSIIVLNPSNILIQGKMIDYVRQDFFKELIERIINYFNTLYDKTENGQVWS